MLSYFKHYKNKPYKFKGIAKHSETQEDLVVYETLYDNPSGKLWVRPKEMFFENIEKDGVIRPRFAQIQLDIKSFTEVGPKEIKVVADLMAEIFKGYNESRFLGTFNSRKNFYLNLAYVENKPVGFKFGYQHNDDTFYSWRGGVVSEFRGLGIAKALMDSQHEWCKKQGFKRVQTKSKNKWRDMILLNLVNGFDIIGSTIDDKSELEIILEKLL